MASATSAMPGPWSRAITSKPGCDPLLMTDRITSPGLAYSIMLRATSETAVAIITRSAPLNPTSAANARAAIRASTMSTSHAMRIWVASRMGSFRFMPQQRERFLQIESSCDIPELQPELHHGKCDLRLNPDDYGLCSTQANHLCQV